jgi:hypothetical protein
MVENDLRVAEELRMRSTVLIRSMLVLGALLVACVSSGGKTTTPEPVPTSISSTTTTQMTPLINPQVLKFPSSTRFDLRVNFVPKLTAVQAIAAFERKDRDWKLPKGATTQLGLYSESHPSKGGFYRAHERPAYLIVGGECIAPKQPSTPPPNCVGALFLNANTGKLIDGRNYIPPSPA